MPPVDDLLSQVGVNTPSAPLPAPETPTAQESAAPDGFLGSFRGGDGRWLHKYKREDGNIVIFPKLLAEMTEEDFYALPISLLDGQAGRIPQTLTVKFRDPQWAGHWFQRKTQDGRRVSEARSMGYVPAKKEDCEWVSHS